ncbi:hypothetical protein BHM03_00016693 [Ensete ventricosum]|nr:hypothetical protein BHM03_00016693 [Ensete ventricosum]
MLLPSGGTSRAGGRSSQRPPLQAAALVAGLPLAALQWAAAPCGRVMGSRPLRLSHSRSYPWVCCHYGWPPLARGLVAAGRPFAGGRPPLQGD